MNCPGCAEQHFGKSSKMSVLMNLANFPVFDLLNSQQIENLHQNARFVKYEPNSCIFLQMELADHIYGVMDGMVKTGIKTEDGKEMIKHLIRPGSLFGNDGILGRQRHTEFAKTLNAAAVIMAVPVPVVRNLMAENIQFLEAVIQVVAKALQQTETRLEVLLTADVRTRIVHFLKGNSDNEQEIHLDKLQRYGLTQQDIALMIGATRQTVAIILNDMRKQNLIDFTRKEFVIKDKMWE